MAEESTCSACGGETTVGVLGTVSDTSLFWRESETKSFAGMRMVRSSGPGLPVFATRCSACGRVELSA
jgi:hypothetical protein